MTQTNLMQSFVRQESNVHAFVPRASAAPSVKPQAQAARKNYQSDICLCLVILMHACGIYLLAKNTVTPAQKITQTMPMLVSLIAPPAPTLVPVIAPPKPEIKPMIQPKKVVEKIRPIEKPTERLVEATTEQVKEQEVTAPEAAPVLEVAQTSVPIKAEPLPEVIEPPRFGVSYLNNPAPDYPSMSRRAGEEGRVVMKVLVSTEGVADDVQIEKSSGFERLDNAALNAVKKWRFIPAKKNHQPLSAYVLVPMKFSLDS